MILIGVKIKNWLKKLKINFNNIECCIFKQIMGVFVNK